MAPRGREGKESAWVKKAPAGAAPDKAKEPENGEDREGAAKGREGGKGKGRKGERPRREARDREEEGDGKSKGRGKGKHKKGSAEAAEGSHSGDDEAEEDVGGAIMKMLKANSPKVIRYEKAQLLSISRLPASTVKPPDLDPIVDKDNKDSILLTRIATGREKHEEDAGNAGDEEGGRRRSKAGRDGDVDREAPTSAEPQEGDAPEDDEEGKARFEKWLGRSMPKMEAASKATPSSGSTNWSSSLTAAALSAGKASSPSAAQAALLQQQALASGTRLLEGQQQAAMQAAAYMQAMTQMQAAAAVARQSSYGSQLPWNSYNAYMNPYMNAYGSGYGSLDPYAALHQQAAAANLSEAMQAKLAGQLNQLASSQAARNMATVVKAAAQAKLQAAKAVPKAPGPAKAAPKVAAPAKSTPAPKPQASPKQRPAAPSAPGQVVPAKKPSAPAPGAPGAPGTASAAPEVPKSEAVPKSAPGAAEGEAEDEAGCSQS